MKIAIDFWFYPAKSPDGFLRDYSNKTTVHAFLNLDTVVPVTQNPKAGMDGFKPPSGAHLGVWRSSSMYLGKESSGSYYITMLDFPEPGRWKGINNPVGFFFDSTSDSRPFLTIYGFELEHLDWLRDPLLGMLENRAPAKIDTWVDWHPDLS
ncbi:MAG TPA: hypothetical protein VMT68_10275 [Caulobacteraceae bacterium]|nr:hypothetical protein [Caulobacteraceae bacterium]